MAAMQLASLGPVRLAASSWRMPPLRLRASAHSRVSACDPDDGRRPASTSTASLPAGGSLRKLSACWVNGETNRRNHARRPACQGRGSVARSGNLSKRTAGTHHGLQDRGRRARLDRKRFRRLAGKTTESLNSDPAHRRRGRQTEVAQCIAD